MTKVVRSDKDMRNETTKIMKNNISYLSNYKCLILFSNVIVCEYDSLTTLETRDGHCRRTILYFAMTISNLHRGE